jgi:class 3 adenylate cyclase
VIAHRTRYARNGDVSIAFQVAGEGPHDLLLVNSWVSQMEHLWTEPRLAAMFERMTTFARFLQFDRRGSGMSDRVPTAPLEEQMDDVLAVLDAAGSERAAVLAETEGTALACLFAATHPERVSSLSLFAPIPRITAAPDYPWAHDPARRETFIARTVQQWGEGSTVDAVATAFAGDAHLRDWFARMERLAVGPAAVEPTLRVIGRTDVRDVLPLIRVPTLVMRRRDDTRVDRRHAEYVRDHVPGARLVELPGSESVLFLDDTDPLVDEIEELVTGTRAARPPQRVLATVLFTDIVGSTERASALGDRRWRELLDGHHALVRRALAGHGGEEVKTLGDGFLATFDGPARAVRCALEVAERSAAAGVPVRAGIHTGECERVGSDVAGIAVHIAARVMGEAGAGEVAVSRTVTDLVAGSGLRFSSLGLRPLRGVPGEFELFRAADQAA